jgi:hypothetical protein
MALGLTQPLTEMSTRNISWGVKAELHVPIVLKSVSIKLLEPSGSVQACNEIALPFTLFLCVIPRGDQSILCAVGVYPKLNTVFF